MRIPKLLASISKVSAVGDISSLAIRFIVDLDIPVLSETWRTERFLLYIIWLNSILIYLFYYTIYEILLVNKGSNNTAWNTINNFVRK